MPALTIPAIKIAAGDFLKALSLRGIDSLFGLTDGKAVGTFVEREFHAYLRKTYEYVAGSAARGIDFPQLGVDLKVTSYRQPQSSSPFRSAEQKIYGLGYHLIVFVYDKRDDIEAELSYLHFVDAIFIEDIRTADYQTTKGIVTLLNNGANVDDIDAYLQDRNLPLDDIGRRHLATKIVDEPPRQGYVTVSNALQWRLQYSRSLSLARKVAGVENLL